MTTNAEYMLFAMGAYVRLDENQAPVPQGWEPLSVVPADTGSGFWGAAFRNPTTGEIVIAYSGTDFGSLDGIKYTFEDFKNGNVPAAVGEDSVPHEQLGPVYPVRVRVARNNIRVDGREVRLS